MKHVCRYFMMFENLTSDCWWPHALTCQNFHKITLSQFLHQTVDSLACFFNQGFEFSLKSPQCTGYTCSKRFFFYLFFTFVIFKFRNSLFKSVVFWICQISNRKSCRHEKYHVWWSDTSATYRSGTFQTK